MAELIENNDLKWYYLHTTSAYPTRPFPKFYPNIIFEIKEFISTSANVSDLDIIDVRKVIIPYLNESSKLPAIKAENTKKLNPVRNCNTN